jgi:hypothetical protein
MGIANGNYSGVPQPQKRHFPVFGVRHLYATLLFRNGAAEHLQMLLGGSCRREKEALIVL